MGSSSVQVLSLCSGIAGIELGLRLALGRTRAVCYVENEVTAAQILAARIEDGQLHDAPVWSNVRTFDGRAFRQRVHILTAGYPCQPFSCAGKRRAEKDPRHLWPEVARIIGECEPQYVFLENVANHLRLGFRTVVKDLRDLGYRVTAGLFTAAEVGAPHIRKRLFVLAQSTSLQREGFERSEPDRVLSALADSAGRRRRELRKSSGLPGLLDRSSAAMGDAEQPRCNGRAGQGLRADGRTHTRPHDLVAQATRWQTPAADSFRSRGGNRKGEMGLDQEARNWPTPTTITGGPEARNSKASRKSGGQNLQHAAQSWPTPAARDAKGANSAEHCMDAGRHMDQLANFAVHGPHSLQDPANSKPGANCSKSTRRLNPRFVEMLMGFPLGWTDCGPLATECFRLWRLTHSQRLEAVSELQKTSE